MSKTKFKKDNKKEERGIIPLANGWDLIVPLGVGDSQELIVAIGSLTVLYAEACKQNKQEKEKLKKMLASYIDCIYDSKLPSGLFLKKEDKKEGGTNNGTNTK